MSERMETTMLSRVADSLYWMSRYLERAEHTARLIDVDLQLRLDRSPEIGSGRGIRLLEALQVPVPKEGTIDPKELTHVLTLDRSNPSSIVSCVAAARAWGLLVWRSIWHRIFRENLFSILRPAEFYSGKENTGNARQAGTTPITATAKAKAATFPLHRTAAPVF